MLVLVSIPSCSTGSAAFRDSSKREQVSQASVEHGQHWDRHKRASDPDESRAGTDSYDNGEWVQAKSPSQ